MNQSASIAKRSTQPRSASRFRSVLLGKLHAINWGRLTIVDGSDRFEFGQTDAEVSVTVTVTDSRFFRYAALNGPLGVGEAYIEGLWTADDLVGLVRLFVRNRNTLDKVASGAADWAKPLMRWLHYLNRNTMAGSRRNIAAHYDLGNELFELFLDRNLMYSSAAYREKEQTLEQASDEKLRRICEKLQLSSADQVLEIGTGWGGFALYAAQNYGCAVTTTTISEEQYQLANRRVQMANLTDLITVQKKDYRELSGRYDKLVSIEMIEAVGHQFLDTYFAKCADLLRPNGQMCLQAITIEDQRYKKALKSIDFIKRYIFPGSFIPSIAALTHSIAQASDLKLFHLEDLGLSYARTLREWRNRFFANIDQVRELGYGDDFIRMWEYYLCYCEGGFLERQISDVQMHLIKPSAQPRELILDLG